MVPVRRVVVPVDPAGLVDVADLVLARADAEVLPERSGVQVVDLRADANQSERSVKSLTTWKHPPWAVCVSLEAMAM